MSDRNDDWPARDELHTLPDSTLLTHGERAIDAKHDAVATGNGLDARLAEKRLEAIRDELKRRTQNRYSETGTADETLNDLDGDLRKLIFSAELRNQGETA